MFSEANPKVSDEKILPEYEMLVIVVIFYAKKEDTEEHGNSSQLPLMECQIHFSPQSKRFNVKMSTMKIITEKHHLIV